MFKTIPLFALAIALGSCGNHDNNAGHISDTITEKATAASDSLYREAIALHDEVMPKMGKIIGIKKSLEQKIDSLTGLINKKADEQQEKLREEYKDLLARVSAAETEMNNWMEGFNPDPQLPSEAELKAYFEEQRNKAKKMRDDIVAAMDSAKNRLGN